MMQAAATATVALKMIHLSQLEPATSGACVGACVGGIDSGAGACASTAVLAGVFLRFFERLDAIRKDSALGSWIQLLTVPRGSWKP